MVNRTLIAVSAAAAVSVTALTASPAQAMPLGAATNVRLADQTVDPVTKVTWWGHRRFHRHHHGFFFHRHHPRFVFLHRHHRHCRWC
jgi:hypothetical protein